MAKNDKNLYLLGFDENELVEIYQALALKDELDKRKALQEHDGQKELAQLLARIKNQFAPKTAARLKENAVAAMDDYLDAQINDELLWQKIEEELRREFGE